MTKKKNRTAQVYRKFEDTDRYMIEVALDNYEDIFNAWDPAPFKRRDIHPDLSDFLEECSTEISLKHGLAIVFYVPKHEIDLEKQQKCIEGLHNFFLFNKYLVEKHIRHAQQKALTYLTIGLVFLAVAILFDGQLEKTVLSGVFGQGLFIGGWVFVWETFSTLAFKNAIPKQHLLEWKRFLDAPIVFKKERRPE